MGSGRGSVCVLNTHKRHLSFYLLKYKSNSCEAAEKAVNANPWKDEKLTSNHTHWAIRMNYWCMLIFMQVIIGKVLIFSPNLQRKVPPSLFPAQWLYFNQKQTAEKCSVCIELTVLAVSQEVHYGKTSSALSLSASPFLCPTKVLILMATFLYKRPRDSQSPGWT